MLYVLIQVRNAFLKIIDMLIYQGPGISEFDSILDYLLEFPLPSSGYRA